MAGFPYTQPAESHPLSRSGILLDLLLPHVDLSSKTTVLFAFSRTSRLILVAQRFEASHARCAQDKCAECCQGNGWRGLGDARGLSASELIAGQVVCVLDDWDVRMTTSNANQPKFDPAVVNLIAICRVSEPEADIGRANVVVPSGLTAIAAATERHELGIRPYVAGGCYCAKLPTGGKVEIATASDCQSPVASSLLQLYPPSDTDRGGSSVQDQCELAGSGQRGGERGHVGIEADGLVDGHDRDLGVGGRASERGGASQGQLGE